MKKLVVLIATFLISMPLFAVPAGIGKSIPPGVGNQAVNVRAAIPGIVTPPGLSNKNAMPHGLQKQGKRPAGWDRGHKEGWSRSVTQDFLGR